MKPFWAVWRISYRALPWQWWLFIATLNAGGLGVLIADGGWHVAISAAFFFVFMSCIGTMAYLQGYDEGHSTGRGGFRP